MARHSINMPEVFPNKPATLLPSQCSSHLLLPQTRIILLLLMDSRPKRHLGEE